jgi:hypothetical protein
MLLVYVTSYPPHKVVHWAHMYSGDKIPGLLPNRQFPLNDIIDTYKEDKANTWFEKIEKMDRGQFVMHMTTFREPTAIVASPGVYKNYHAGVRLCRKWDEVHGGDKHCAITGYKVALLFAQETQYLPGFGGADLSMELAQMQRPDEQLYRAQNFARVAWHGMATYPRVHTAFERLLEHSKARFSLPDESREYYQAGMALPYMLAFTAGLIADEYPNSAA